MKQRPTIPIDFNALDWRRLAALGQALGLGAGLLGVLVLESAWSFPAWCLLLAALAWRGWDAQPRLGRPLVEPQAPAVRVLRLARDGPFVMVELPGGDFLMGSSDSDDMATGQPTARRGRAAPRQVGLGAEDHLPRTGNSDQANI